MDDRKGKRPFICVLSSSEDEERSDSDVDYHEEEDSSGDDDDGFDDEKDDDVNDGDEDDGDTDCNDETLSARVIRSLEDGTDLYSLSLKHCKAYLRKHGLRIGGTKAVCMERIKRHWRMKDENGGKLYPRSSFVINCTGDVCRGDTILFTQKVYAKFDKVTRHGRHIGMRTVAGRVVKESYGAAKQQHTFTVEVLWSRGVQKLPPLFPLLVKGRNLYKLKTFRQLWENEAERQNVLEEKHRRGKAARFLRGMKKKKAFSGHRDAESQKLSHKEENFKRERINNQKQGRNSMNRQATHSSENRQQSVDQRNAVNTRSGSPGGAGVWSKLRTVEPRNDFLGIRNSHGPVMRGFPTYLNHPTPSTDTRYSYVPHFPGVSHGDIRFASCSNPSYGFPSRNSSVPCFPGINCCDMRYPSYLHPSYRFPSRNSDR